MRMIRKLPVPTIWIVVVASVALLGTAAMLLFASNRSPLPQAITQQLHFAAFVPKSDLAHIETSTIKYDEGPQLLTYACTLRNDATLTLSQQPTPESFSDVPQAYDKLVEQMGQYAALDTINGKIYLTKPRNSKDKQIGVSNNRGTLLFVRTERELSEDTWRQFFNSLVLTK